MRRIIALSGLIALLAASCSVTPEIVISEVKAPTYTFTLSANMDDEITKTAYANDKSFSWSVGDAISVLFHNGSTNQFFPLTAVSIEGARATFSGEITEGYVAGASDTGKYWALYPAGSHTYTKDAENPVTFNIPGSTDYTAPGTHFSANLPLCANSSNPASYTFSHMCGTYKFQFRDIDVDKVEFIVDNPSRGLSGNISTTSDSSHTYLTQSGSAPESDKRISFIENVSGDKTAVFYVPYRGWHSDFQPTITLKDASTGQTLYTRTAKAAFSGDMASTVKKMVVVPPISVSGTVPSSVSLSFIEYAGEVTNPERGMMSYNRFDLTSAGPYSEKSIPQDYTGESLAFLLFYLPYYIDKYLDANALNLIQAELNRVRAAKKKAVIRFAYSDTYNKSNPQEATPSQILAHIDQLASTISDNADIVYLVQAGWLGTYGEWYYKTNNHDNSVPAYTDYYKYTVSGSTVSDLNNNHKNLLDRMLLKVPSPIQIGLRTAFYKRYYLSPSNINAWTEISSWDAGANNRLALFNDGFRGSSSDVGTFKNETDWTMWYSQGNWLAIGGELSYKSEAEFALVSDDLKDCDNSIAELKRQHWSYLHYSTSNRFMKIWYDAGRFDDIKKALGYRLVLNSVNLSFSNLNSGTSVNYSISIQNKGCAPVIYSRPFKLVLLHNGVSTAVVDNLMDVRDLAPGAAEPTVLNGSFTLPYSLTAGDQLAIWLPDADILDKGLDGIPAYSIRLANSDVTWSNGFNVLYTF